ncbi:helicase [Oceanicola sp. 22II-s10i]|uniref:double-strand break repair protein AddB n=1 Tax=Oceanicola sp. 22II-s10i TaxID=1317116 RepID=UPI000B525AF4|nr:double-strand break repair protein AddB [Oceanicola sp. 22II-s10i]OWU85967.1 helicase [Oceanicola sp. 22II-s10i]
MFDPLPHPRVYGMPPGADFPAALVEHLSRSYADRPPQDLARVRLIVNTRRMARRIRDLFDRGPALLLPRIELVTDLGISAVSADLPPATPPLRRRLELVELIAALLDAQPDLAPRAALFDLADSLARILGEMDDEGVPPEALEQLDVTDLSGHWARALRFLTIARGFQDGSGALGPEARQRLLAETTAADWAAHPPADPVILAGSTGSRGSTFLLMQAIARLPQGAVVLPGFDFDMPEAVWATLTDPLSSEDHPQYRFARIMTSLGLGPEQVALWPSDTPAPERNRVLSLALRPAPVTDQWMHEGPDLDGIETGMNGVTLLEAPSPRAEALAIAMRLRQAAEEGVTAALITPDRMLTRQVAAALDRWDIVPDDSAGQPLHLSPPGRFLRHVGGLFSRRLTAEALLTLLKHPLTHTGTDRGPHLLLTRALELDLRRGGPPFPDAAYLRTFSAGRKDAIASDWVDWLIREVLDRVVAAPMPLADLLDAHIGLAERIAQGHTGEGSGNLWTGPAGRSARDTVAGLEREAGHGGPLNAMDYDALFSTVLTGAEVRERDTGHANVLIWGTLEARVQGADLVILGGLNEGSWPELPPPDPWMNREMRHKAGLLLPDRKIGLSAHDFQQAAAAREVWLTRAVRSQDAETVPSRWISRLTNLLAGLPGEGQAALAGMKSRGAAWIARAQALETVARIDPAPRPAPCPPPGARPTEMSVTEIERLIRDPYAVYARRVLRLRKLDPLMRMPDALLRGTVLHKVLEIFIRDHGRDLRADSLLATAREVLDTLVPWAEARFLWHARLARVATPFLADEAVRQGIARPVAFERDGTAQIPSLGFTLRGKADRIDIDGSGNAYLYDYKTGRLKSEAEQIQFDRQLLLSAAMVERGAFEGIMPKRVAGAVYIGLGSKPGEMPAPLDAVPPGKAWEDLTELIRLYHGETQGFTARRAMFNTSDVSDYDQLARFGEWDVTTPPDRRALT